MQNRIDYDNQIVRWWVISALVWAGASLLIGVIIAFQMVYPELNLGPWLTFGRLRPVHTNGIIFGFTGSMIFASMYYSFPRLLKTPMWSKALSRAHFWMFIVTIVGAVLTLLAGFTQSKEYAELEWPLDLLVAVWWLTMATNFFMTIKNRQEKHMYVAIWFFIATIVTITVLYVVNNISIPSGLFKSYSVYSGATDASIQWWYGHNAVAFFLTTPILGMMYYYLPKHTKLPIFSHRISIIHFWSLIFIYIWAGPHHLLYSPIPNWAQSLGMLFSIMLIAPSWGGMLNGFLTLTQSKEKLRTDATLKFILVGITFYGMSTFEGPMMSIRSVNVISHNTDWTIGHVHGGALGWVGGICFAALYYLVPRLWNAKLYSEKLAEVHFWTATIGILLYVVSMWVSGVAEGLMWRAIDPATGGLMYPDWIEIVQQLAPYRLIRAIGGLSFLTGFFVMVYNLIMTIRNAGEGFVPVDLREGAEAA
ncbi:cytochrome c oxidase, cbb3-type, subunit I [Leptonema illini DSM 21528]|jgi:cytochrome c oxidase cbb3-type subunit 1|uniref:cytochrome-c oxidase n=2 Tax=Leptonema illini TaxID=183 RepID=H2CET0_9LEPT|nr:cytochrome-c oxidase, cbb3-type subunit I [Leptonema illini]EHQ07694.1 cytochrome c oxidase, cbb3-type, subunit I [Leptonema illini DSM 21528]